MTFESDLESELKASLKGPSYADQAMTYVRAILEPLGLYISIPPYKPENMDWEITFRALGLEYRTVNKFWKIFYKINKSHDGEVSLLEFLNYFDLDRTPYVVRAFQYCDTVGGGEMDFLEFVVSVWNFCTLKPQTLVNFTFDLYDMDDDGEIAYDECATMIKELYGPTWESNHLAKSCLNDMCLLAEKYSGGIPLDAFIRFQFHHSMLLFPAFAIQRRVQEQVAGLRYWTKLSNQPSKKVKHGERRFDPRHVQAVLRTYKTGSAAAILTHTGDPNEGLREWIKKGKEAKPTIDMGKLREDMSLQRSQGLNVIAEWRRRRNPKKLKEYMKVLKEEDRERRKQAAHMSILDDEARRLREEKEKKELLKKKGGICGKIKDAEPLDDEEEAFAREHRLYEAAIAGLNFLELLKDQEEADEKARLQRILNGEFTEEELVLIAAVEKKKRLDARQVELRERFGIGDDGRNEQADKEDEEDFDIEALLGKKKRQSEVALMAQKIKEAEKAAKAKAEREVEERLRLEEEAEKRARLALENGDAPEDVVVVVVKEIPLGSNGRPKVKRLDRLVTVDGKWADRPPPVSGPPPDDEVVIPVIVQKIGKNGKRRMSRRNSSLLGGVDSRRGSPSPSFPAIMDTEVERAPSRNKNSLLVGNNSSGSRPTSAGSQQMGSRRNVALLLTPMENAPRPAREEEA